MSNTTPQVVTVQISGDPIRYVSTQGFVSKSTDTPASTPFLPRITGVITYSREVGCTAWANPSNRVAVGAFDLIDTDGKLDSWLTEQWRDRTLTIRRGLATEAYDDHAHVAFAVAERPVMPDFYTLRTSLRDKGALLEIPAQQNFYPALIQAPTLEGTPLPICIGNCEGVPTPEFIRQASRQGARRIRWIKSD